MAGRTRTATAMAFRDQLRRPLVSILIVVLPAFVVFLAVVRTRPVPRRIELPGGIWAMTTMKELHGPEMAKIGVAFAIALVGAFVAQSALHGDRRLVVAGLRAREALLARLAVLGAAIAVVVTVAVGVMALSFTPRSWPPVIAALILTAVVYAAVGALAGASLDPLPATYLILFLAMTDLGVVQTPMFHAAPARFAWLLPGYGPTRVMLDGAYGPGFHATGDLLLALAWSAVLVTLVYLVLRRGLTVRRPDREPSPRTLTAGGVSA